MGIYNTQISKSELSADQKATDAAAKIVKLVNNQLKILNRKLCEIKDLVAEGGGKAAVVAKMDSEVATELNSYYAAVKSIVETHSDITCEDL